MKKLILFFLMIATLYATEIDDFAKEANYERDYKSALSVAKEQKKMLMLLVVADYCPWCKKFEKKTLMHSSVQTVVKKNFIPIVIDKNKDKGTFPDKYISPLIPIVYFIDPNTEKTIHKSVAYKTKKDYKANMDEAIKKFNSKDK